MEVQRQLGVVPLDDLAGGLLHCLGADATHFLVGLFFAARAAREGGAGGEGSCGEPEEMGEVLRLGFGEAVDGGFIRVDVGS